MTKTRKIAYWVFTLWMALGMVSTAYVQLMHADKEATMMQHLGYPLYFLTLLGIWKILGTIAALVPRFPLVKEWAYAGFFFAMSGAAISHLAVGDGFKDIIPSLLLLVLTILSWAFRPADRKI
jgi:hypothetical protein